MTDIFADQVLGDAELHVGFDVLVVGVIDLRDERLEALLVGEKMQVRRAHIVPALGAQEFTDRAVDRNRIAGRFNAAEIDVA